VTGRVADMSLSQHAIQSLQASPSRVADLQHEASSATELTKPSDSPVDTGTSLRLRASLNRNTQLAANISDAAAWLGTTGSTIGQVVTQLPAGAQPGRPSRDCRCQRPDDAGRDCESDRPDSPEPDGARQHAIRPPPAVARNDVGPTEYDSSGNYVGTTAPVQRTIAPGVQVPVHVTGEAVFGPAGNDIFTRSQRSSVVHGGQPLTALSAQLNTLTQQVETVQGRSARPRPRVDTEKIHHTTNATTMQQNLSNLENVDDADAAQVLMNLQAQEATYQAALAAAAKAIQPSLAAFLQ
jgi:flagellar hook-associated protein 3 FlgL